MHALLMALATGARERREHHESGIRGQNDA
jgi:hypothetical protein